MVEEEEEQEEVEEEESGLDLCVWTIWVASHFTERSNCLWSASDASTLAKIAIKMKGGSVRLRPF